MDLINKMENRKLLAMVFALLLTIIFINTIQPVEQSYCCEKTIDGALCQNAPLEQCDKNFRTAPTSCESTAYCKLGTCINGQEGICSPNTPQSVCIENGGYWEDKALEEITQCQLGCCILGEKAAFVTQTRCSTLSALNGLETNYRADIQNQIQCAASASPDVKGACVYEEDYIKKCKFVTREECAGMQTVPEKEGGFFSNIFRGNEEPENTGIETTFYEGYLCSAESLGTICGPSKKTTCYNEKVYFLDTCNELANIYDSSKVNDITYWTYVKEPEESCGYGQSNANSRTCGNCDYYIGSTCKAYRDTNSPAPKYGDYICADLSCTYKGETYEHGEEWCVTNTKTGLDENLPGTEHYVLKCYDGEITFEPCSIGEYRNKICVEDELNGFSTANCVLNLWQDCTSQTTKEDCLDEEKRDCKWIEGFTISSLLNENGESLAKDEDGEKIEASCVPKYSPAYNFWESESEGALLCPLASDICVVEYEFGVLRNKEEILDDPKEKIKYCVENCYCLKGYKKGLAKKDFLNNEIWRKRLKEDDKEIPFDSYEEWINSLRNICFSLGDCGSTENYLGEEGYYDDESLIITEIWKKAKEFREENT